MSKKIALFILAAIIGTLFTGCAEKTQIEKAQDKIVSIGEQFINYDLTIDEAKEQLESIIIPETEGTGGLMLNIKKDHLEYLIIKSRNSNSFFDDIQETIQEIKNHDFN